MRARVLGWAGAAALLAAAFLPATRFPLIGRITNGEDVVRSLYDHAVTSTDEFLGSLPPGVLVPHSDLDPLLRRYAQKFLPFGGTGECLVLAALGTGGAVLVFTSLLGWAWILGLLSLAWAGFVLRHYGSEVEPYLAILPGGPNQNAVGDWLAPTAWMAIAVGAVLMGCASVGARHADRRPRSSAKFVDE